MTKIDLHHHVIDGRLHCHTIEIIHPHITNPDLLPHTKMLMILITERIDLILIRETIFGRREGPLVGHIGTNRSNQV
mgnify:CR=1 FL=1